MAAAAAAASNKRKQTDLRKLIAAGYPVEMSNNNINKFIVRFQGPPESLYAGGEWKVRVELPDAYPMKPPIIAFGTPIYHPNISFSLGYVCLDVLANAWSHESDLNLVFGYYLPQLLVEPNPSDSFNKLAAALMRSDPVAYNDEVKEYVERYAKAIDAGGFPEDNSSDEEPRGDEDDSGGENSMPLDPIEPR